MSVSVASQVTKQRIITLLEELPPESLAVIEQFAEFLYQKAQPNQFVSVVSERQSHPYHYPTVPVPMSVFEELEDVLPDGYDGDALADTEALYDEV